MGAVAHRATRSAKAAEVPRRWFVIDASDQVLGRLATRVASILRGKHRAIYTPHVDTGEFVVVVNAEKVKLTGRKTEQKTYYRHTGWTGHRGGARAGRRRRSRSARGPRARRTSVRRRRGRRGESRPRGR